MSDSEHNHGLFRLRQDMRAHWAVYLGIFLALLVWFFLDPLRRAQVDPENPALHMTDFTVYTAAAQAMLADEDPYAVTNIRGWPYIYPPFFAVLVAPLAYLPDPWPAGIFFWISVLCLLGSYCECRHLLDRVHESGNTSRRRELMFLALAFATGLFPTLNCLQRGQVGLLLLYCLLLGVRLALRHRGRQAWVIAGVILMIPVAIKLTPALPVAFLAGMLLVQAQQRTHLRPRGLHLVAGLVLGGVLHFLLLPAAVVGWDRNLELLDTFHQKVSSKVNDVRTDDFGGHVASKRNQSLSNAAYRGGNWLASRLNLGPDDLLAETPGNRLPMDHPVAEYVLLGLKGLVLAALAAVSLRAALCKDRLALLAAYGLAIVATFLVSPVARGHYYLLWTPGCLFLALWLWRQHWYTQAWHVAVWPVVLTVLHYALLDYAGRVGLLGLGTTVWFFVASHWLFYSSQNVSPLETKEARETKEKRGKREEPPADNLEEQVSVDSLLNALVRDPQAAEAAKRAAEEAREKSQKRRSRRSSLSPLASPDLDGTPPVSSAAEHPEKTENSAAQPSENSDQG